MKEIILIVVVLFTMTLKGQTEMKNIAETYYSEDVKFENKADEILLAGTLTLPQKEGNFPIVILIGGSGPLNRNEEVFGHKPFLVLADHLTKKGLAVLRYDKRGIEESEGNFATATTLDFAKDVEAAIAYIKTRKDINHNKIGLVGHSEGGIIAPMVAAKYSDINFVVLLAASCITGEQTLLLQEEHMGRVAGKEEEKLQTSISFKKGLFAILKTANSNSLKPQLNEYIIESLKDNPTLKPNEMDNDAFIQLLSSQLASPWMQFFINYDPAVILEQVKCPVLALNGEKDVQVISKVNLEAIKSGLANGNNARVIIEELPSLNHLFQECETGSMSEYSTIKETISSMVLNKITNWIWGV